MTELTKIISERWNKIDPATKSEYEKKNHDAKARYDTEKEAFEKEHGKPEKKSRKTKGKKAAKKPAKKAAAAAAEDDEDDEDEGGDDGDDDDEEEDDEDEAPAKKSKTGKK